MCGFSAPLSGVRLTNEAILIFSWRIRRYTRAKQKLIKLLEEYRQALIHQAVTGKIDVRTGKPYPAYKDSGVPWLGHVPEHWEVRTIKSLAGKGYKTFVDGDWIESPYIRAEGIRLIQTGNIGIGHYREKEFRFIDEETFVAFRCTEIMPGDVLICRLGDPVGRACLAPNLGVRMIASVDVCILKPNESAIAAFLVYAMSSPVYLEWIGSLVRGSTRDRVSRSMLGRFCVPLPPSPNKPPSSSTSTPRHPSSTPPSPPPAGKSNCCANTASGSSPTWSPARWMCARSRYSCPMSRLRRRLELRKKSLLPKSSQP